MSRRARNRFNRRVIMNPVAVAIGGVALLDEGDRAALQRIIDGALDALRVGPDHAGAWASLADALNVAEALSDVGICSDDGSVQAIGGAQAALAAVHGRYSERKTWAMRADEIKALECGTMIARIQLDHCSVREYMDSVERVKRRVSAALAGNAPRGARVCVA